MEVSQLAQLDTHAVIGGEDPEAFGMADTPEFYQMLSASIYRDKIRAVVRETICNGWDAHIMGGCTDKAVQVTLTDEELVIKDFGPGIPHEKMRPIYCIYGVSTKVKDESQTGGFGLGSKSPFAVTDHFSVVSCFAGTRSVYAISRGGKATSGKPDMRRMVAVPTTESGVTVTVPIKKEERESFAKHIRAVAKQGGMLVTLNGELLERFDYEEARKTEFCVVAPHWMHESRIYTLYGTVLYPVMTTDPDISKLTRDIEGLIGYGSTLVIVAPPNSVEVTPSRESLSFTDGTTDTIKRLLDKACTRISKAIPAATKLAVDARVAKNGRLALASKIHAIREVPEKVLSSALAIAEHAVRSNPDNHIQYDRQRRLCLQAAQRLFKDDRRTFRRALKRGYNAGEDSFKASSKPLIRIASKMGMLKDAHLFNIYAYRYQTIGSKTNPLKEHDTGVVRPVLCVARNLRDLRPTMSGASSGFPPDKDSFIAGLVMRQWTAERLKQLRALAEHYKLKLVIFDYEAAKKPKKAPVKREKIVDKYFALGDFRGTTCETANLENPKYFLMSFAREGMRSPFQDEGHQYHHLLAKRYPETAVISSKTDAEKLMKRGAVNLTGVIAKRIAELAGVREVQYAYAIREGLMCNGNYHHYPSDLAISFAKLDMRIAKRLFPDKATPGALAEEGLLLNDVMNSLRLDYQDRNCGGNEAKLKIWTSARETYKAMTTSYADQKFSYLSVLAGIRVTGGIKRKIDDLHDIIVFLQDRESKSKLTESLLNPIANAQKEAA
jgi:hypothetical protein